MVLPEGQESAEAGAEPKPKRTSLRERFGQKDLCINTDKDDKDPNRRKTRLLKHPEKLDDTYEICDDVVKASNGGRARLFNARRRSDDLECVIKRRPKGRSAGSERAWLMMMEHFLNMQQHLHVLDVIEIVEDDFSFYEVMDKCSGGELLHFLMHETDVPEADCKKIMREIIQGLQHLHDQGIVHRDVKPENIMFTVSPKKERKSGPQIETPIQEEKVVKLIDFETCLNWGPTTPKSTKIVGTPGYIAPESLMGEFSPQSDLWGVGVIFYILMTGEMPWGGGEALEDSTVGSESACRMYEAMKNQPPDWECVPWPDFPQALDLCQRLLSFNQSERLPTAQEALSHPWFFEGDEETTLAPPVSHSESSRLSPLPENG